MLAIHVMPTRRVTLRRMEKGKDWFVVVVCVEKMVLDMGSDSERHGKASRLLICNTLSIFMR
jgi:hypothetical protein